MALSVGLLGPVAARAQQTTIEHLDFSRPDTQFEDDTQGVMHAARAKVAGGDLDGAIKLLATYFAAHPHDADPARLLGDLYYRSGDESAAEATYRKILAVNPSDKVTHNRLGTVLAAENRVEDAIAEFDASLPGTDAIFDLVALHQRKGDLAAYVGTLETVAQSYPSDANDQSELAQADLALDQIANAQRYFARALDDDPQSLTALNGLAVADMDAREYPTSFELLHKCLALDPLNYACMVNEGAADLETQNYDAAQPLLQHAETLEPERAEALVNFGYLADARNDWKGAVAWYVRALAMSPYSRDAYFNLGLEYQQHSLYQQAEAVLVKGLSIAPTDGGLHILLGLTYQGLGQNDLARAQFSQAADSTDERYSTIARNDYNALGATPTPR
jgi:tetratricopeptide (TPR) repeat protein